MNDGDLHRSPDYPFEPLLAQAYSTHCIQLTADDTCNKLVLGCSKVLESNLAKQRFRRES